MAAVDAPISLGFGPLAQKYNQQCVDGDPRGITFSEPDLLQGMITGGGVDQEFAHTQRSAEDSTGSSFAHNGCEESD